jgi:hypothetical protein
MRLYALRATAFGLAAGRLMHAAGSLLAHPSLLGFHDGGHRPERKEKRALNQYLASVWPGILD